MLSAFLVPLVPLLTLLGLITFFGLVLANWGFFLWKYRVVKMNDNVFIEYKSWLSPYIWFKIKSDWFKESHSKHLEDEIYALKRQRKIGQNYETFFFHDEELAVDICEALNQKSTSFKKVVVNRETIDQDKFNKEIEQKLQDQGL